jgi:hypothetical protein
MGAISHCQCALSQLPVCNQSLPVCNQSLPVCTQSIARVQIAATIAQWPRLKYLHADSTCIHHKMHSCNITLHSFDTCIHLLLSPLQVSDLCFILTTQTQGSPHEHAEACTHMHASTHTNTHIHTCKTLRVTNSGRAAPPHFW